MWVNVLSLPLATETLINVKHALSSTEKNILLNQIP